ncbi:hypothetical protein DPMN_123623 [Dreissena polymorpha]|uniref:C-type lectin domain-containing protein n=1 Tax=Dreissena polymorpha TaxID=45954 RepID=A0A9D4JRG5_DREPO|nr:hypothetical protein DPMN_123623 [Dreissena polymorpha]
MAPFWIGVHDVLQPIPLHFIWANGHPVDMFHGWAHGEPSGNQYCVQLQRTFAIVRERSRTFAIERSVRSERSRTEANPLGR